jgi:predicted TIM-barrel fold metal-dependent hydrolase
MQRRDFFGLLAGTAALQAAPPDPDRDVIETHVHLFSDDFTKFPSHPNAWKPQPYPLEQYLQFARKVGIRHAVHVSAEPYQDDHRYVIHTVQQAPSGFLKGTLLLDTTKADSPQRLAGYSKEYPGKFVAVRVHCSRPPGSQPATGGPIRDRDLGQADPLFAQAGESGVAIQAHIQPWFAPALYDLAERHQRTRVILDHFGHPGVGPAVRENGAWRLTQGKRGQFNDGVLLNHVLRLSKLPNVVLKVSSLQYASAQPHPHTDVKPWVRKAFDAFGPDRMMWGSLGHNEAEFKQKCEVFDANLDWLSAADRRKIRFGTAHRFFGFPGA